MKTAVLAICFATVALTEGCAAGSSESKSVSQSVSESVRQNEMQLRDSVEEDQSAGEDNLAHTESVSYLGLDSNADTESEETYDGTAISEKLNQELIDREDSSAEDNTPEPEEMAVNIEDFAEYISVPKEPVYAGAEVAMNPPEHFDIVYDGLRLDISDIDEDLILSYGLSPDNGYAADLSENLFDYRVYSDQGGEICFLHLNSASPEPYLCGIRISVLEKGRKAILVNDRNYAICIGDFIYDYLSQCERMPSVSSVGNLTYYEWTDQESTVFRITTDEEGAILEIALMQVFV